MALAGVGVDILEIARMERALERTPRVAERAFTPEEREYCERAARPAERYAARWAAREAVLKALGTANLLPSTVSVTTSFLAVYLTFRRSPLYALGYAANDVVLIILWLLAARSDKGYLSVVVCFAVFLVNDIYGFLNWRRMEKKQASASS